MFKALCAMFVLFQIFEQSLVQSVNPCQNVQDGYFVRDPSNCQGYYYCRDGEGFHNMCPDSFYYNEQRQLCDYPENVMCHLCAQTTGIQILPHPEHCNKFITCIEGVSYVAQCVEGDSFDRWLGGCNPSARVTCTPQIRCPSEVDSSVVVYLPSVNRCDEYFICYEGSPVQMLCAPGLYWDSTNERCDFAEKVQCILA